MVLQGAWFSRPFALLLKHRSLLKATVSDSLPAERKVAGFFFADN
jgi:hypothetical protein